MVKIISLHGYLSSHDAGFERAISEAFSSKHDFEKLNLLGYGESRFPKLYPIHEIVSDAVSKIEGKLEEGVVLVGKSLGGYPVLDVVNRSSDVAGVVLMKPLIDMHYTFSLPRPFLKKYASEIRSEGAIEKYLSGSIEQPFHLGRVPALVFNGEIDSFVGTSSFAENRIVGEDVRYVEIDGDHISSRYEASEDVVREVGSFLERL